MTVAVQLAGFEILGKIGAVFVFLSQRQAPEL